MARRGGGPGISQLEMLSYVALYGSERAAARELGISRGVVNDVSRGRYEGGSKTVGAIASAVGETVAGLARAAQGLIHSLAGGDARQTRATAKELTRQGRREPGAVQERASAFQRQMAALGLNPDGSTALPPGAPTQAGSGIRRDALGREITPSQQAAYDALKAAYDSNSLTADQYERFRAYQTGGAGALFDDVEGLLD